MNRKTKKAQMKESGPCLCQGTGPVLSELVRRLAPPEEARRHFEAARLEFLKGIRALVDARIEKVTKAHAKGEKIAIE